MSHTRSSFVPDLIFFLAALFFVTPVTAQTVDVPVRLESGFIQRLLQEQLFTEPGAVARVWDDGRDCNHLQLSAAQTFLEADGRLRTRSAASARVGTVLAGICLPLFNWQGYVEIFQQPLLGETPGRVDFEVVDSRVFRDEQATGAVGTIWDWIKLYVHPRFGRLHVDLQPLLQDLGSFLAIVLPGQAIATQQLVDSVRLSSVAITDQRLELGVRFELPVTGADAITAADTVETPLSDAELARWHAGWQHWDAFLTMVIKHAGADTLVPELRADLFAVLLDARHDLLAILTATDAYENDPVPALFVRTWEQLGPVLQQVNAALPARTVLHYLSFMTAADALIAIEALPGAGDLQLNADALRRMARMIAPAYSRDPVRYDTRVDQELRELFGFGAALPAVPIRTLPVQPLDADEPVSDSGGTEGQTFYAGWFSALLLPLQVVLDDPYRTLVQRLNGWVPTISGLHDYLPKVQLLLDLVSRATLDEKPLESKYGEFYRPLVLTTAWQESCWRQFVKVRGEITPIRSHAGAVGIMQVNQHVWRGLYDVEQLQHDVGYNAAAGSEILHHYLRDYAIARGEHKLDGGLDNLLRSTYAMYNGGPRHIARYRRSDVSASLRAIDEAFWQKYQAVRAGNTMAVAQCYTG